VKKLIYRISAAIVVAGITRWHMVCCTMAAFAFHDRERISPICCGTGEEFESSVRASGKHGDSEPTSGNNGKFRKWEYGIL